MFHTKLIFSLCKHAVHFVSASARDIEKVNSGAIVKYQQYSIYATAPCVEIKGYSVAYFDCITVFEVLYH